MHIICDHLTYTMANNNFVISVYLDVGNLGTDTAMISFSFTGTHNRFWDIKVTQIPCKSNYEYVQDISTLSALMTIYITLAKYCLLYMFNSNHTFDLIVPHQAVYNIIQVLMAGLRLLIFREPPPWLT